MASNHRFILSPVQEQFWLQHQQDPGGSAYNMASLFEITGSLNIELIRETLEILISRHDMLRARFAMGDKGPEQIISDGIDFPFSVKEYSPEDVEGDISEAFDIETGPLFRFYLYKKGRLHFLLFVFHHLIIDLRSKDIFGEEFSLIYNSLKSGVAAPLGMAGSYESYVSWTEGFSGSELCGKMREFWESENLVTAPINLTADYERPPVLGSRGHRLTGSLQAELFMNLHRYCEKENTAPFLVLLSAYYLLLHKYSGQDKISVGVPRTNRPESAFDNVLGCFVNILPMVVDFSDVETFSDLHKQVRRQMLLIHRNQYMPYLQVIKAAKGEMDRKYNPLFQVGFTNEYPMELTLDDLTVEPLPIPGHGSQLDFFIYFWKRNGVYHWECEYNSELFVEKRVELLCSSFQTILEQIVRGKDFSLERTECISEEWKNKVCFDWNDTAEESEEFKGVHRLFEDCARNLPENTALRFRGESLTYSELNRKSNLLAADLIRRGAGPETIIGLSLERSFEMVIGLLGILKAGASYMPMEPSHPGEYKKYLVGDTGLSLLLTKKSYEESLRALFPELTILCLDGNEFIHGEDPGNPVTAVRSSTRAYLFYTSGSTGKPKGVEVEHGGLTDRINWMDRTFRFGEERRTLLKTPYNFDVSGMEFWLPLTTGAPLVIAEPEGHLDNSYLADVIRKENISVLHFVPSLLNVFLNSVDSGSLGMIEDVLCCGEALPAAVVNDFYRKFPRARLHNLYGPTEATIFITYWDCRKECSVVPIGRPVSDTQVYVLDKNHMPLPPGVLGDLYLAGSGLSRGYFKRDDLTEKVFVPHFLDRSKKMYFSGDLARWSLEGDVLYFGRSDNQVQLHGQRIELGEIEATLNNHRGVKNSAVIVDGDFGAAQRLAAYIVRSDESADIEVLKSHILKTLPKYMVPSQFFFMDELPLSGNGKLDRKRLPKDLAVQDNHPIRKEKIEGELENRIARIWEAVLDVPVGPRDNFFDLGGTSLQIMEIHRELVKTTDSDVSVAMLFQYGTIESLAGYLRVDNKGEQRQNILSRAERQKTRRKKIGR